jgi:hypothetical protein
MKSWWVILFSLLLGTAQAQQTERQFIKQLFDSSLVQGQSWPMLEHLCKKIGHRLSGSPQAQQAVLYTRTQMLRLGFDSVWLQPVMVPVWVRGPKEKAYLLVNKRTPGGYTQQQKIPVEVLALGGSVATPPGGLQAQVIEVAGIEALKKMRPEEVQNKIVFLNEAFDPRHISTFESYGHCVANRAWGAKEAGAKGAAGVIVRSMTHRIDAFPHTGSMQYAEGGRKIPAAQ